MQGTRSSAPCRRRRPRRWRNKEMVRRERASCILPNLPPSQASARSERTGFSSDPTGSSRFRVATGSSPGRGLKSGSNAGCCRHQFPVAGNERRRRSFEREIVPPRKLWRIVLLGRVRKVHSLSDQVEPTKFLANRLDLLKALSGLRVRACGPNPWVGSQARHGREPDRIVAELESLDQPHQIELFARPNVQG